MAVTAAGERNHLVTVQYRASETTDTHGHKTPNWATRFTAYAKEVPLTSSEAIAASALTGIRTSAWVIPYRGTVSITDQIVVGSRTLQITGYANPDGRRIETRLVCTERLS